MKTIGPIVLTGFKACGKSTIGPVLAQKLGMNYTDTDEVIENLHEGKTGDRLNCREIYRQHGEEYFKSLELTAVKKALAGQGVVSLGGGALVNVDRAGEQMGRALFVYLTAAPDVLFGRIMQAGAPPFFDRDNPRASFDKLLSQRIAIYEKYAVITVDNTADKVNNVVDKIIRALDQRAGQGKPLE